MYQSPTEVTVGQSYEVPCVRITDIWVPVLGPPHSDHELDVGYAHYHLDWRFIEEMFMLSQIALILDTELVVEGPVLRSQFCYRQMPEFPPLTGVANFRKLERNYRSQRLDLETKICPHRGFCLKGIQPNSEGHLVCPGHGLAWNAENGACQKRHSR